MKEKGRGRLFSKSFPGKKRGVKKRAFCPFPEVPGEGKEEKKKEEGGILSVYPPRPVRLGRGEGKEKGKTARPCR